jgi:chemotaxis protein CheC
MILNQDEQDALNEIINIGFGRAASALSMLVSQRVIIEAPLVTLNPLAELYEALAELSESSLINVHQVFRGTISGDAMLLVDTGSATILVDLLEKSDSKPRKLTAEDRETLVEVGNILLSAFTGSFGNLLKVHLTFTVPNLQLESLTDILTSLAVESQEVEYALVVRIRFRLSEGDVSGYLMIVMGIQSLETLLEAMRAEGFVV